MVGGYFSGCGLFRKPRLLVHTGGAAGAGGGGGANMVFAREPLSRVKRELA